MPPGQATTAHEVPAQHDRLAFGLSMVLSPHSRSRPRHVGGGGGGALGGRFGAPGGSCGDGAPGGDAGFGGGEGEGGGGEGEGGGEGGEGGEGGGEGLSCIVTLTRGPRREYVSVTRSESGSGGCIETRMMTGTRSVASNRRQQWHARLPSPGAAPRLRDGVLRCNSPVSRASPTLA